MHGGTGWPAEPGPGDGQAGPAADRWNARRAHVREIVSGSHSSNALAAAATVVGTAVGQLFIRYAALTAIAVGLTALALACLYYGDRIGSLLRRRPGGPLPAGAPAPGAPWPASGRPATAPPAAPPPSAAPGASAPAPAALPSHAPWAVPGGHPPPAPAPDAPAPDLASAEPAGTVPAGTVPAGTVPAGTAPGPADGDGTAEDGAVAGGQPPSRGARRLAIALAVIVPAGLGYAAGYWVLGYGFARGRGAGTASLLLLAALLAAVFLAVRRWRRPWLGRLRYRMRTILACSLAAAGLSAGGTVGQAALLPPCPPPAELRVLTSPEDLGAIQAAARGFEQYEPGHLHTACFAVDVTAYAAPSDGAAGQGLAAGWDAGALAADGPRPDIWIPASSAEVTAERAAAGPAAPRLRVLSPSIGSSPLVIGVPDSVAGQDGLGSLRSGASWDRLYAALGRAHVVLSLPSPQLSEAGQLGIAGLYPALAAAQQRVLEEPDNFPADSETLLCDSAQSQSQQSQPGAGQLPATAYLVSEAALRESNARRLSSAGCAALSGPAPPPLTAFYPAGAAALDFPFATVGWGPADRARGQYESDFAAWLATRPARALLRAGGLRPPCGPGSAGPGCAAAPSAGAVRSALASFQQAQAPARILVGVDDSGPMRMYLPRITAALDADLGPATTHVGRRDSFGIWALPGPRRGQVVPTDQQVVPFGPAAAAEPAVGAAAARLAGHDHSADFDALAAAGQFLYAEGPASPRPGNSVILLTDGDGYSGRDPGGQTGLSVISMFDLPPPGSSPVKLFIIAFGPQGCAEAGTSGQSLAALAGAARGTCLPASSAPVAVLLAQVLDEISAAG